MAKVAMVYIITQAWDGDIRGVYLDKDEADSACAAINAQPRQPPAVVEEHEIQRSAVPRGFEEPYPQG